MPIKVAFWNVNMGNSSFVDRVKTFQGWCANMKPDLLFLEEVGSTLVKDDSLAKYAGMSALHTEVTLDKNDAVSGKNLVVLGSSSTDYRAKGSYLPGLDSKRSLVKVYPKGREDEFCAYGIHANASKSGGAAATKAALNFVVENFNTVIGGDFNCSIANVAKFAVHPVDFAGKALSFTQWNKTAGSTTIGTELLYFKLEPHDVIDYVIPGKGRKVAAMPNCANVGEWINVVRSFDHAPVVYSIG
jgi:hypothetical protein